MVKTANGVRSKRRKKKEEREERKEEAKLELVLSSSQLPSHIEVQQRQCASLGVNHIYIH